MGNNYYIAAIELSSSKISGVVGMETTEGIRILATASTPVDGFISKGIVRNVDKASQAITDIINILDATLKEVSIKKAYISFAGLSTHSIRSKVSRGFGEYIKITKDIIDDMERENHDTFQTPEGYKRLQAETQEYKFDGNVDLNPIGAPTQSIECNYLNIVMKEQFYKQLHDSFDQAGIEIVDSLCAARLDAEILLPKDLCRNGCALVNIGAETTTISIYDNEMPKMLTVLPLGSNNITRDLTAERLSFAQAEEIKITRGYKSTLNENEGISNETLNSVINARMSEILQNVRYRIEESGERVRHIVFTGGGSKLKNLALLLEEFLPNFTTEIKPEPQFNLISESEVNVNGVITTALYGLLKQGKENCCEDNIEMPQTTGKIFNDEEMENTIDPDEEARRREEERKKKEEEKQKQRAEKQRIKEEKQKQKAEKSSSWNLFGSFFDAAKQFIDNATREEDSNTDDEDDDDNRESNSKENKDK